MKRAFAVFIVACLLLPALYGCAGQEGTADGGGGLPQQESHAVPEAENFEKETYYVLNEETGRNIYTVQIKPTGLEENDKVPVMIYIHGGNGNANSLLPIAKRMAEIQCAGVLFECCGGNNGKTSEPKSDGGDLYPSHYSSRISDLEAVLSQVKTLDFVDTDRVYVLGESYGGIVTCLAAPQHNEDFAGIILVSVNAGAIL